MFNNFNRIDAASFILKFDSYILLRLAELSIR